jgi:aspartate kinase
MQDLYEFHMLALDDLRLFNPKYNQIKQVLSDLFGLLSVYLKANREYSPKDYDYVVSFGERFSAVLLASALNKENTLAQPVDSAKVIVTTNKFNNARALIPQSIKQAHKILRPLLERNKIPVITGFYGATEEGIVATLGRGGSDYSATILAHVLDAKQVILWKEVNGVFSEDPKINKNAQFLPELSYEEALDLARKGAKILHPEAMLPVSSKAIPVWVKNTFNPKCIGTKIWKGDL